MFSIMLRSRNVTQTTKLVRLYVTIVLYIVDIPRYSACFIHVSQ